MSAFNQVAVFGDEENTTFKDNREFKGSIFKQIDEAFRYIMLSNRTSSVFKGLERIDKSDYPEAALREALLNSVVHRDYSYSGSIIININDKQMEFVSIGGLLPGLTLMIFVAVFLNRETKILPKYFTA